jgi:hypothetical protein
MNKEAGGSVTATGFLASRVLLLLNWTRLQIVLAVMSGEIMIAEADEFSAPCWSVRRMPSHGRLTPCGN